ncbi:tRNA (adenine(58)-N(1))-methyltransferase non-catalytic subunit TRM6 [Drosophila gunungcola]|uniref:tRNA (adenine(58)-N(1))-methyltransferase non-catalytic subunit TRM6 n=1 Tax=Drosophila gunungcola TaxID=103775 RepID=UPI0022E64182|nr:tRNA (adenine(58)-N(1))-methyltransferase non-catalytic subunit TRM6 [Drosophila gunungcola]
MATEEATPRIQLGDYIVIQRQKYTKLQKFGSLDATATLGKETLELKSLLGQPYGSTFKMCVKETKPGKRGAQRQHTLELCSETELRSTREVLGISSSGADNRDIRDDGEAQTLKPEDIAQLREECNDSSKIIEKLVENSKTFHNRTEYSQEKYLLKKEKKYFEFVQIRRPTIRLMLDIFYRQDSEKVMGIRVDTLSQIISYSGVCGFGNYLLYESGTNGLLPAAMLNSIGAGTEGTLVHMHPGNVPQKQSLLALKLPLEQQQRCVSVNLYSVLREFYQGGEALATGLPPVDPSGEEALELLPEAPTEEQPDAIEPITKKPKLEESKSGREGTKGPPRWHLENKRATALMNTGFDSLVLAAKEHPSSILQALLPLVKPSRPVVLFSTCKELLQETYMELKTSGKVTGLHLTSNWLRSYQILPNRTHPEVNMSGNSGYLLTGYTLR